MRHTKFICKCNETYCQYCGGGLFSCTVCGGAEGTLTTECPGFLLDQIVLDKIYDKKVNFIFGRWITL